MNKRVRKQLQELRSEDFESFNRWEYASDEEGDDDQDECTLRPVASTDNPFERRQTFVQAVFFFPNGRIRLGMVTIGSGEGPAEHQPILFSKDEQIAFYAGTIKPNKKELAHFSKALQAVCEIPFPIRYVSSLADPLGRPLAYGELLGLY